MAADAPYEKIRDLARGGMGQVELVVRRKGAFARAYARKRLLAHFAAEPEISAMFLEEARVAGLIRHANTVPVLDVGEDEVGPFLVMDFIAGVDAAKLIGGLVTKLGAVPVEVAVEVARQAAEGLHAVHTVRGPTGEALGLIHRDVTPSNLLVGFDGCVRVTDFGVARALDRAARTQTGVLKGKAGYMSPEQLRFETIDRRSDLFSLGVVLYELLLGQRLYGGGMQKAAPRILREPAPDIGEHRPEVPDELVALLFRLLAKDPDARPADAREVARELDAIGRELPPAELAELLEEQFAEQGARTRQMIAEALEGVQVLDDPTIVQEPSASHEVRASPRSDAPTEAYAKTSSSRAPMWVGGLVLLLIAGAGVTYALRADPAREPVLPPPPTANEPDAPPETAPPATVTMEPDVEATEVEEAAEAETATAPTATMARRAVRSRPRDEGAPRAMRGTPTPDEEPTMVEATMEATRQSTGTTMEPTTGTTMGGRPVWTMW